MKVALKSLLIFKKIINTYLSMRKNLIFNEGRQYNGEDMMKFSMLPFNQQNLLR